MNEPYRDQTLKQIAKLSKAHSEALMEFFKLVEREQFYLFNDEIKVIFANIYSDVLMMLTMCRTLVNCIKDKPSKKSEVSNAGSSDSE